MARLRFILVCCTLAVGIFAMAEAAWADRLRHSDLYDPSAEAHRLVVTLITAKTPEVAKAARDRLSREYNIAAPDPSPHSR